MCAMFGGNGATPSSHAPSQGVNISLEALSEWQIQEIGFDGVEKYIRPLTFSDHVRKLSSRIEWRELIGTARCYDDPALLDEDDEDEEDETAKRRELQMKHPPEAGPWHSVAKHLHEAREQMNVLLDTLAVLKLPYLTTTTVLDPMQGDVDVTGSKQFHWITRRKALNEAGGVLQQAVHTREQHRGDVGDREREGFLAELRAMRERWRLRKIGMNIVGDLGYRIFGTKYSPREMFDVLRNSSSSTLGPVRVELPCDLLCRCRISVSIEIDDENDDFPARDQHDGQMRGFLADQDAAANVHWRSALDWAQETLICKHIFAQLSKETVSALAGRTSFVLRDGVLLVSLFDHLLLRVHLCSHPFISGPLPHFGDAYLTRALRQLFIGDQCTRWVRHRVFTTMPLTSQCEVMDSRGPLALTTDEIERRMRPVRSLLDRLIACASHYALVQRVVTALNHHMEKYSDPQLTWKWLRATSTISLISASFSTRHVDPLIPRAYFHIRITDSTITLSTKDGHSISCHRSPTQLSTALRLQSLHQQLSHLIAQARSVSWQLLHANANAVDEDAEPGPTLFACNASATRTLFVQLHMHDDPSIRVGKTASTRDPRMSDDFLALDFQLIPGNSFARKMDNLFAILAN